MYSSSARALSSSRESECRSSSPGSWRKGCCWYHSVWTKSRPFVAALVTPNTTRKEKKGSLPTFTLLTDPCLPSHPFPSVGCKPEPTSRRMTGHRREPHCFYSRWSRYPHASICRAAIACDAINPRKYVCRPVSGLVSYESKA